jgi:hypothetical protein
MALPHQNKPECHRQKAYFTSACQGWGETQSDHPEHGQGETLSLTHGIVCRAQLWVALPCLGEGLTARTKATVEWHSCHLVKTETYLTTLKNLVVRDHWAQLQLATTHKPTSWQDHFRDPTCTRGSITSGKHWAQTPWAECPPRLSDKEGNIHCHTAQHTNLEKRHTEKAPVKNTNT